MFVVDKQLLASFLLLHYIALLCSGLLSEAARRTIPDSDRQYELFGVVYHLGKVQHMRIEDQ